MKHSLKLLSLLLLLTAVAYSQTTINITTNSTDCSVANSCAVLNVTQNNGAAMFQLTGTWTGTVSFEATSDGTNWVAINVYPLSSTTAATTATANGMYLAPASSVAGSAKVRLRASAAITGTVGGTINPSNASARVGGGGSGGGNTTSTGMVNGDFPEATGANTLGDSGVAVTAVALTANLSAQCSALGVVVTTTLGSPNVITCFPPTAASQFLECTAYSGGQCTTYTWATVTSGVSSFSGDGTFASNSGSTGAVTLTLATAGAHKWWGNNTGSTAAPGYESLTAADIPNVSEPWRDVKISVQQGGTTGSAAGCSIGWDMPVTGFPIGYAFTGTSTTPSRCGAQFAASAYMSTEITLPNSYVANTNLTMRVSWVHPVAITGADTWGYELVCQSPTSASSVAQPTLSTEHDATATTVNGTVLQFSTVDLVITPNSGGVSACNPLDQMSLRILLHATTASDNPVLMYFAWKDQ